MPPARKSHLWRYFDKVNDRIVVCNICHRKLLTSGNTSNMMSHMRNKHSKVLGATGIVHEGIKKKRRVSPPPMTPPPAIKYTIQDEAGNPVEMETLDQESIYIINSHDTKPIADEAADRSPRKSSESGRQRRSSGDWYDDQYDVLGRYITLELRSLQSETLRKRMKRRIQQIIVEMNMEDERITLERDDEADSSRILST